MILLANVCYAIAAAVYLPRLLFEMLVQRKNRHGWRERRGFILPLPGRRERIWIHAVSVGEANATRTLVLRLKELRPGCEIVVSSTTDTGHARALELYPGLPVFRFPLDFSWMVRRALRRVNPTMIVLVELELWPNLVTLATHSGVPVVVFNGRLSERSARRFGHIRFLVRPVFSRLAWVGAQDAEYARRFEKLGTPCDRVSVTGSVKYDTAPQNCSVEGAEGLRREVGLGADEPLWVCGSTGPGEERILLDAYRKLLEESPRLRLVIVPRKPERFEEVARLIRGKGFGCFRRSRSRLDEMPDGSRQAPVAVILGDTMGELRRFYSQATVAFVGRSLVPMGGSDVLEVAALGKPIVVGPHTTNFSDAIRQLNRRQAVRLTDPERLAGDVRELLDNPSDARRLGENARRTVQENRGATERSVRALIQILDGIDNRAA